MSRQSIVLMSAPAPEVIWVSEPVRVDNWFTDYQRFHTIAIAATNFRGRLIIEATIKLNPTDSDWFPVALDGKLYLDYPRNGVGYAINANLGGLLGGTSMLDAGYGTMGSETSTASFNFSGRFIWMRARIDRSVVIPLDANPVMVGACGFIDRILLNL